jgi:ceramide synthetase
MLHRISFGAVIMFLHDWADISTQFVRCSVETNFKNVAAFFSMMMALSWFYTRLFVLP